MILRTLDIIKIFSNKDARVPHNNSNNKSIISFTELLLQEGIINNIERSNSLKLSLEIQNDSSSFRMMYWILQKLKVALSL